MKCNNCGGEWNPPKNISLTLCPFCNMPVIENESKLSHPYEVIRHIVNQYSENIFLDNKKLSALLMDLITEKTKERNIIGIAVQAGIPSKILAVHNSDSDDKKLIFAQCKLFLCEDYGMNENWATFAVNAFAYGLGWNNDINPPVEITQVTPINQVQVKQQKKEPIITHKVENTYINNLNFKPLPIKSLKDIIFSKDSFKNDIIANDIDNSKNDIDNSKSIATKVFTKYKSLKNIIIPNNTPSVDLSVLEKYKNLTSNTIPNGVTSIRYRAFENNKNLISIIIPNSVTSIGCEAFMGCTNLKSITIPSSVISIGDGAFKGCINLTHIVVDKKNTRYYSNNAMLFNYDRTKLLSYPSALLAIIPNGVTYIGNSAFGDCENLKSVIIPSTVSSIEYNAFWGCVNLTNIVVDKKNLPYSSKNGMLFDYYKTRLISYPSAKKIDIPSSITHIGYGAFGGCRNLTDIIIPDNINYIGNYAFESCINLKSINIPDKVTFIGDSSFNNCTNLNNIIVSPKNMRYSSKDGILFNYSKTAIFSYPSAVVANIPDTVNHICDNAFLACKNLKKVIIPNSVSSIGYMAFAGCENLSSVTMPSTITYIGNYAFINCDNLVIDCDTNSYVEKYCKENKIKFNNKTILNMLRY